MHKTVNGVDIELTSEEEAQVLAQRAAAAADEAQNGYKWRRQSDMPQASKLLECLWRGMDSGELTKCTEFYDLIKAVYDKHPKPEE